MKKLMVLVVALQVALPAFAGEWRYTESKDAMRGTVSTTAFLPSSNKVDFKFPYQGGAELIVSIARKNSSDGRSTCGYNQCSGVILSITKGQFACMSMHENDTGQTVCYVSAKFDDGAIEKFVVKESSATSWWLRHDSNIRFLERLQSAKTLTIEANFHDEGPRQFQYDVNGLKWATDRESGVLPGYGQPESVW